MPEDAMSVILLKLISDLRPVVMVTMPPLLCWIVLWVTRMSFADPIKTKLTTAKLSVLLARLPSTVHHSSVAPFAEFAVKSIRAVRLAVLPCVIVAPWQIRRVLDCG